MNVYIPWIIIVLPMLNASIPLDHMFVAVKKALINLKQGRMKLFAEVSYYTSTIHVRSSM